MILLFPYSINSYNDGVNDIYVITTTGGQASIDAMLNSVYLKPTSNYNKNNAAGNNLVFDATLTAYQSTGFGRDTASVSFSSADNALSVKPVTDAITASETITYVDRSGSRCRRARRRHIHDKNKLKRQRRAVLYLCARRRRRYGGYDGDYDMDKRNFGTLVWGAGGVGETYTFDATHTFADIPVARLNDGTLKFTPTLLKRVMCRLATASMLKRPGRIISLRRQKSFTINAAAVVDGMLLPAVGGGKARTHIYRCMRIYLYLRLWTTP